jgi:protein involved in polysaccharide export with SLBB domain
MRFVFLLLLLAVTAAPAFGQVSAPAHEPPLMMPGDRLELVIWRNLELSGVYTIAADGTLLHPLMNGVRVAEVPIAEARGRMEVFLRDFDTEPLFTFQPLHRIYVGGAVRQGQYHMAEMSVGRAITDAGGSTTPNPRMRVRLIRAGETYVARLDGSQESELLQTQIRSGDQILLEERPSFSRSVLSPTLQVVQTVTTLVATYVYLNAIFGS